jgi:uncharacterized membrane protein
MGEIRGGLRGVNLDEQPGKVMVPMQVGSATVYVVRSEEARVVEDDRIRPVSPISPQEAFQAAGEFLHECVRLVGEKVETLAEKARPHEVAIEFSLSFEVTGKASVIPIFVTGEASTHTGLKVKAVWKPGVA